VVTVNRVTTEAEFQAVVDWWNHQRHAEIEHRWGYMGRTLDSVFPLPAGFATRREETMAALRPYWAEGEIWVCRDLQTQIRHIIVFQLRPDAPDMALAFWSQPDFDYRFSLPPGVTEADLAPPIEADKWDGAPKDSVLARLGRNDPFEAIARQIVFENLLARGVRRIETRESRSPRRPLAVSRTPTRFDKWVKRQEYRLVLEIAKLLEFRAVEPRIQAALQAAEAL